MWSRESSSCLAFTFSRSLLLCSPLSERLEQAKLERHRSDLVDILVCLRYLKPGSHMPPLHLGHGGRYYQGYCSNMRTKAAGNVAPPSLYCRHACEVVDCEQSLMSFFFAKLLHAKPKHASSELSREPREMRASRLNPLLSYFEKIAHMSVV